MELLKDSFFIFLSKSSSKPSCFKQISCPELPINCPLIFKESSKKVPLLGILHAIMPFSTFILRGPSVTTNLCPCVITFVTEADSCKCLGFDGLSFYNFLGLPDIPVVCNNQPPVTLPCIGPDAYYSFQGTLHCSKDTCPSHVNWAVMQNGQTISSGPS